MSTPQKRGAAFVWDPTVASHVYSEEHPLKPKRLVGVYDTLKKLGTFELPGAKILAPREATQDELERVHDPEYIDAVMRASANPRGDYAQWGLDPRGDTPPFRGMHDVSLLTTGGSLIAMEESLAGTVRVAANFSGGLHHAMRRRASGFCIYNDPAIVCGVLADRGLKVAYVDIDAHHGDGVQREFYDTDQVLTISLHESGMTLFPGSGFASERGEGKGAGYSINVALPAYTDDPAYIRAFDAVVPPLLERFSPDVLVTQQGIDPHFTDPLSHLNLSTRAREYLVRWFRDSPYVWTAMGGGGYSLDAVRRSWSIEFLVMQGADIPAELHDEDPPIWPEGEREGLDEMTDQAIGLALKAAW